MQIADPHFEITLADSPADVRAAQALRYQVFVEELGGTGAMVDHAAGLERDGFDAVAEHLLLRDTRRAPGDQVVGVYRLMGQAHAEAAGRFYSDSEYDLTPLIASGRRLLELGRSCLHRDYRGGTAMLHLWQALAAYVAQHEVELLFGVASFPGTDLGALAQPLSLLHHRHLAPEALRPTARLPGRQRMDLMPADAVDRPRAIRQTPALIKAYLRLGGMVGAGAYLDHAFNCTDVCLVLDTATMSQKHRAIYERPGAPR